MHHRWDLENCIFRQDKTTGHLAHCFGHDPAIIGSTDSGDVVDLVDHAENRQYRVQKDAPH